MFRVTVVTMMLAALLAGTAVAEIGPGRAMVSLGGSYFGVKLDATDDFIDGAGFNIALDVVHPTKPISFLVAFNWSQLTTEDLETDGAVERTLRTWPTFLGAKIWFGPDRFKLFVGAAAGFWFGTLETTLDGIVVGESHGEGIGFSAPAGVSLSLTRGTNLNVGYTLNVLPDNPYIKDNLAHSANVSLGFSWGN